MTILNTYTTINTNIFALLVTIVFIVVAFAIGVKYYYDRSFLNIKMKVLHIAGIVIFAALSMTSSILMVTSRTTYVECILDKEYSVVELYENYEIKDIRGDIWVLTEKEGVQNDGD